MTALKGIVQFDYAAEAADELSLKVGDVINNVKAVEDGWCQGTLNGKSGMFPDNFVKIVEEKAATPTSKSKKKVEVIRLMKVTFPYEPANEDELKLETGDIIEVLNDEEEGWANGQLRGKQGVFPTNFATNFEDTAAPTPTHSATAEPVLTPDEPPKQEDTQVQPKKVKGIGFGNIFGDGPIKLRQAPFAEGEAKDKATPADKAAKKAPHAAVADKPGKQPPAMPEKPTPHQHQHPKKSLPVEKCRVMFDYPAENEDELSLMKGEIVIIIDKNAGDAGWWVGETVDDNGKRKRGVFPDNFVTLLPSADEDTGSEKSSPKESAEGKPVEAKQTRSKIDVKKPSDERTSPATKNKARIAGNSLKRPAPQVPPVLTTPSKPVIAEVDEDDISAVVNTTTDEQKLTHYKRPGGPKNRRKPDSAGRRERAKEAQEAVEAVEETMEDDAVDDAKVEPVEPSPIPAKKESKRGIQVMPNPVTSPDASSETPSWLKNLKNRASQKKPQLPMAVSPSRDDEQSAGDAPNWLSNLKKSKSGSQIVPPPKPVAAPHLSKHESPTTVKSASTPTTNHVPARPPAPEKFAVGEKEPAKTSNKTEADTEVIANETKMEPVETKAAQDLKKMPVKPHVALQPPSKHDKPAPSTAAKPKPPPPKAKPMLPGSKPVLAGGLDELRDEIKSLRETFTKEMSRLSHELEEERRQRQQLQHEVSILKKKQIG